MNNILKGIGVLSLFVMFTAAGTYTVKAPTGPWEFHINEGSVSDNAWMVNTMTGEVRRVKAEKNKAYYLVAEEAVIKIK